MADGPPEVIVGACSGAPDELVRHVLTILSHQNSAEGYAAEEALEAGLVDRFDCGATIWMRRARQSG